LDEAARGYVSWVDYVQACDLAGHFAEDLDDFAEDLRQLA
jgi:hypothetical protein